MVVLVAAILISVVIVSTILLVVDILVIPAHSVDESIETHNSQNL